MDDETKILSSEDVYYKISATNSAKDGHLLNIYLTVCKIDDGRYTLSIVRSSRPHLNCLTTFGRRTILDLIDEKKGSIRQKNAFIFRTYEQALAFLSRLAVKNNYQKC